MTQENDKAKSEQSPLVTAYIAVAFLCAALVMFGDLIFQTGDTVISHHLGDGSHYFARMRDFGFSELANGNMPLWNPHIYSGTPFVGAFQSGMFYPLNFVYMILPLANATNVDTAFHVFLMSLFMYLWARKRGISPGASFVVGIVLAYGGASFVRVMAGQITMLQALSWAPLILLSIDHIVEKRSNGWMLIGIGATTMQILAGHPQSLFMTAITAGLYSCIRLANADHRLGIIIRLLPYGIFPPLMACVQLWTGWDTAAESMRSGGVSYEFATSFSFHPENLLTLLMPALFGNVIHVMYWGRWAFWDSTVFVGIGGLVLILCSLYYGPKSTRRFSFALMFFFMVLALGSYTPVFGWMFELPGFSNFRSPSKFMFPASLFASILIGLGVDAAIQGKITGKSVPIAVGITGAICLIGAAWLWATSISSEPSAALRQFIDQRELLDDTFFMTLEGLPLPKEYYVQIARMAYISFLLAGITCLVLSAALWFSKAKSWVIYVIPVVAVLEVLIFARIHRATFDLSVNDRPIVDEMFDLDAGVYRVMDVAGINNSTRNYAVQKRQYAIWGYDPVILDRYAQFVVFAGGRQTFDPVMLEDAIWGNDPMAAAIHKLHYYTFLNDDIIGNTTLFRLLRCRYMIVTSGEWGAPSGYWQSGGSFPRYYFSNNYSVYETKESLFEELKNLSEDEFYGTTHKVLLESEPNPKPAPLESGATIKVPINVLSETTDSIEFEFTIPRNTMLIITDSYSKNWRAVPVGNSDQQNYDVMPVDYTVRGIPLAAGNHHFTLEYAPTSYTVGRWISLASLAFFLSCCVVVGYKSYKRYTLPSKNTP
jgi:hypothetical protein